MNVKVAVRVRPFTSTEVSTFSTDNTSNEIQVDVHSKQIIAGSDNTFTFDHIFDEYSTQSEIYSHCVQDLIISAFDGYTASVLAYGQTGSGKTYTMGTSTYSQGYLSDNIGIIPRAAEQIFEIIDERKLADPKTHYKISIQYLEIYGDDIRDLLDKNKTTSKVTVREAPSGDVFVVGATEEVVGSSSQLLDCLSLGSKNRVTAQTQMNDSSSRSHGK